MKILKQPWNRQKVAYVKNDQNRSYNMSQGPLCPNLTQKVQREVSQIANRNLPCVILLGGLSVNLNHLKSGLNGKYSNGDVKSLEQVQTWLCLNL